MFDATALRAISDELNLKILHGRVQDVVQLDALSFGFEIYAQHARHYVYAGIHADDARIHLVSQKLRGSGETPSAILMLLRKYAEGAIVDAVAPLPNERVLRIRFDHSTEGISTLVVETIGRYSNLILLDADDIVIDAVKRVTAQVNRARVVLPKKTYVPPPPQDKLDPSVLVPADLDHALRENRGTPLWQVLVKTIAGVSPLLAREIVFRAAGRVDAPAEAARPEVVLGTLARLSQAPWQPTVAYEDDSPEGEPAEYAPYVLTQYERAKGYDSTSAAIEAFCGAPDSYEAAKEPLRAQIAEARDRLARKRDALGQSLPPEGEIDRLRASGELILGYASQIKAGQTKLRAETETGPVEIRLDPRRSPVENAQDYFREYRRLQDAAARVPALLRAADADLQYAEQMLNDMDLAENRAEIDAVVATARDAGLLQSTSRKAKARPGEPRVFSSREGFTILVGKNARQNEEITFHRARPDDLWLHARDRAGAHVVIVGAGREIPETTVEEAAGLAAAHSQAREEARVDVIVTPRRNVHRLRGGQPGMVTVRESRTVRVAR